MRHCIYHDFLTKKARISLHDYDFRYRYSLYNPTVVDNENTDEGVTLQPHYLMRLFLFLSIWSEQSCRDRTYYATDRIRGESSEGSGRTELHKPQRRKIKSFKRPEHSHSRLLLALNPAVTIVLARALPLNPIPVNQNVTTYPWGIAELNR